MKLSQRLQGVADYIKKGNVVADIGTDHGYLPIYLTKNNICPKVYASDVNIGPLESARIQVGIHKQEEFIQLCLSHGANKLIDFPINQVVIAGMGGGLIAEIIKNNPEFFHRVDSMVLQPMTGQRDLREFLMRNGYSILDENLAREKHHIYQILHVSYSRFEENPWSEMELCIGRRLLEKGHDLLPAHMAKQIKKWQSIFNFCQDQENETTRKKWEQARDMLSALKGVKDNGYMR